MIYLIITLTAIAWFNLGVLTCRSDMNFTAGSLESMVLPLRLLVIFFAPIGFVIFERDLLFAKADRSKGWD